MCQTSGNTLSLSHHLKRVHNSELRTEEASFPYVSESELETECTEPNSSQKPEIYHKKTGKAFMVH